MEWKRDEYISLMTFNNPPRQMFVELFGLLIGLEDEWREQGATEEEISLTAFDWDYLKRCSCGANTGLMDGYKQYLIEETDSYRITRDEYGRKVKLMKGKATIPLPLEYPVHDMDSWLAIKPKFEYSENRIDWDTLESAKISRSKGALSIAGIPGGFDLPRQLLGEEEVCLAYYLNEELIADIMATIADTSYRVLEEVSRHITIDKLSVHEDMAGKSGSLIGPNLIGKYVEPYYNKIWEMLKSRGTVIFEQDSDGNMNSVVDAFLSCGLTAMYPMEPAAGMDVVKLRKQYGSKLAMRGGIDKHIIRRTKAEIRTELEYKMQDIMLTGGMVFGLDHRIPNGTSIDNYRYYVDTGREILGIPKRDGKHKGWFRSA